MFNKLLNRITSPEQGRPPGRSLSYAEAEDRSETTEGFICPHCLLAFATAETLQNHYESAHQEGVTGNVKDEKDPELEMLKSQIRALEEGKSLTSSEILLLRKQLTDSMEVNIALRQERENLQKKAATEMEEMAAMKHLMEQQQKECNNLRNQLKELKERKSAVEHQLQQRPAADDVVVLRQELVSVQKMMDKLTLEKEAEKDAIQDEYSILQAKYSSLEEQKEILEEALRKVPQKEEIERLRQKILEDTATIAQLQETLSQKESENKVIRQGYQTDHENLKQKEAHLLTLSQQLTIAQKENQNSGKEKNELKSQLRVKDSQIEDCQRILSERVKEISEMQEKLSNTKERIAKLESERAELYVKIEAGEGTNTAFQQLQQENEVLHRKMKDQQQAADESLKEAISKHEMIFQQYQEIKSQLSNSMEKCQISDVTIAELNSQLSDARQRLSDLQASFNTKMSELQQEMIDKELQSEAQLQLLRSEKEELVKDCSNKTARIQAMDIEINDMQTKYKQLQELSNLYKEELKPLQATYEEVANKLNRSESERQDLLSNIASLKDELKRVHQELEQCQINEQQATATLENFNEVKKELDEKITSLDSEVTECRKRETDLVAEKEQMHSELNIALKQLSELTDKNTELNHSLTMLQNTYQQDQVKKNEEISELTDAKQLLINQKLMLQSEIDRTREEMQQAKVLHQHELQHLQEHSENLEQKIEDLNKKLDEEMEVKKDLQNQWQIQESNFDAEISILNENLSTLREDLISEHSRCENLEKRTDELKGDNLELQAKLENALDERRALLERCLKSEEECEKLRNTSLDLRHKLDDTVAALQELGRENQTLQVENTKHQSRKWAEDAEVTHCTMCGKQFSVTIRKHHCRNCGNIFCNDCSSKSAPIALSKKPVRVCDNCFSEVSK